MRSTKYGLGLAITAACMAFGTSTASAERVEVLPTDVNAAGGEWSSADTRPDGTRAFVTGPVSHQGRRGRRRSGLPPRGNPPSSQVGWR